MIHTDCDRKKYNCPALKAAATEVDTLYIQRLIGHTDYAFTANKYTHPTIEALREAMSKL